MEEEKQKIIQALRSGKYEVEYEPVDSIFEYTKYDGTKFYVMEDLDGPRTSTDMGSITFNVDGLFEYHQFVYDMNSGEWSNDDLCENEEIISSLEGLKEFINVEDYDGDLQREIFIKANNLPVDTDIYWYEDDDCPKDIESLNGEEVQVPLQYCIVMSHGGIQRICGYGLYDYG